MPVTIRSYFWLHLKKCAGTSFRKSFNAYYTQTNRKKNPRPWHELPRAEWNDAINNYRIDLGRHDFKRMLYVKEHMFAPDEFESLYKFAIVRNPYDRAVSLWKYLNRSFIWRVNYLKMKFSFSYFLSQLPVMWTTKADRHIALHTAPMWDDITDDHGCLLLDGIYKLEEIDREIITLNRALGTDVALLSHANRKRRFRNYRTFYTPRSKRLVEQLYENDIVELGYSF
ncbi:MAG: hypothetical protein GF398_00105 [Chitinivibrionales bacterium]|nr:hypothetical protein [Chitinivibrionales bacterium]